MTLIGTPPAEWVNLIDSLVPNILELVLSTWENKMTSLAPNAHEDPTTEELCRCLRQNRNSSNLPFRIDIQMVELDPTADQSQGRMDIVFSPMVPREDIYFCLECKRLRVMSGGQLHTLATEYVTQGMMRFINGKYAPMVQNGGMLGYVLDSDTAQALNNVGNAIQTRHIDLGMLPPGDMQPSSVRPSDTNARETHHTRPHNNGSFQIYHLFVPGVAAAG